MTDQDAVRMRVRELAAESARAGDATGWFDRLYQAAARGDAVVPWATFVPNPHLVEWATAHNLSGTGHVALVVGCGFGDDAEFLDSLGFTVIAFDISSTAIDAARDRFPESSVTYRAADLLNAYAEWIGAFDLVVEIYTVQALFGRARATALSVLPRLVAPHGTLLIIAHATDETDPERDIAGLPWPLTRSELEAAAGESLLPVDVEQYYENGALRWRAELQRPEL
jgi:hypothetical protein